MKKMRYSNAASKQTGVSVVELVVAVALFATFMGVFVAVTEVMGRYSIDGGQHAEGEPARSLLLDQHYLQQAMDDLVELLSQPALSSSSIQQIVSPSPGSAGVGNCSSDPINDWGLPGSSLRERHPQLPVEYQFCIYSTSLVEASESDLLADAPQAKPGIYVITAIPEQVSINAQPMRRIFCRPKPFCS